MLCRILDSTSGRDMGYGISEIKDKISHIPYTASEASASPAKGISPATGKSAGEGVKSFEDLITFVKDRPGHDMRYAIDARKIRDELGWEPKEDFESGFRKTVRWYLENREWTDRILSGDYKLERLGKA